MTTSDAGTTGDIGTTGTTTTGSTGPDPVAECKAMTDPPTACSDCGCENCLEEYQACEMDEGCKAIHDCAEETGCSGLDCLQSCGDVINMYGGLVGMSASLGLEFSGCLESSMCPCG